MTILDTILQQYSYEVFDRGGMVCGRRPDGTVLSLFRWGNRKHAEANLIPRTYVVIEIGGVHRFRLPTVEWEPFTPIHDQNTRSTKQVLAEFAEVFAPALGLDTVDAVTHLRAAGPRYDMNFGLDTAMKDAGLAIGGFHAAVAETRVFSASGVEHRVYGRGENLFVTRGGRRADEREAVIPLAGLTWNELVGWLRRVTDDGGGMYAEREF